MKKMMDSYMSELEKKLSSSKTDLHILSNDLLVHIKFYQHERLIHFLVTMLVSIITVILLVVNFFINNLFVVILLIICILLLIPYFAHYYYLENKVQAMYALYDLIQEKIKK